MVYGRVTSEKTRMCVEAGRKQRPSQLLPGKKIQFSSEPTHMEKKTLIDQFYIGLAE